MFYWLYQLFFSNTKSKKKQDLEDCLNGLSYSNHNENISVDKKSKSNKIRLNI